MLVIIKNRRSPGNKNHGFKLSWPVQKNVKRGILIISWNSPFDASSEDNLNLLNTTYHRACQPTWASWGGSSCRSPTWRRGRQWWGRTGTAPSECPPGRSRTGRTLSRGRYLGTGGKCNSLNIRYTHFIHALKLLFTWHFRIQIIFSEKLFIKENTDFSHSSPYIF
jgi:hypothetical protein